MSISDLMQFQSVVCHFGSDRSHYSCTGSADGHTGHTGHTGWRLPGHSPRGGGEASGQWPVERVQVCWVERVQGTEGPGSKKWNVNLLLTCQRSQKPMTKHWESLINIILSTTNAYFTYLHIFNQPLTLILVPIHKSRPAEGIRLGAVNFASCAPRKARHITSEKNG